MWIEAGHRRIILEHATIAERDRLGRFLVPQHRLVRSTCPHTISVMIVAKHSPVGADQALVSKYLWRRRQFELHKIIRQFELHCSRTGRFLAKLKRKMLPNRINYPRHTLLPKSFQLE